MLACDAGPIDELFTGKHQWLMQPKLDGVRCLMYNGVLNSRTGKLIPNQWLQRHLHSVAELCAAWNLIPDGELVIPGADFNAVQSVVMSDWQECHSIQYHIFDRVEDGVATYRRIEMLGPMKDQRECHLVPTYKVDCIEDYEYMHESQMQYGFEGSILRRRDSFYKHGRATLSGGQLLRCVDWARDEATLIECTEKQFNFLPGTKRKENLLGTGTLGAMVVKHKGYDTFNIGTGFSQRQREEFWRAWTLRTLKPGTQITFKYKPSHMKDKPQGVFVGIRLEELND